MINKKEWGLKQKVRNMKKLNLGCGPHPLEGYVNVDIQKGKGIDKSFNLETPPYPFKANEFDYILANQVLEHVGNLREVFNEFHRICKNNAIIQIMSPYVGSKSCYFDLGHKSFFNDRSFTSICGKSSYELKNNKKERFKIVEMELVPQRKLKWVHPKVLKLLAVVLNNIHVQINCKIMVVK